MLNATPFAEETPETIDNDRTTWDTIEAVSNLD